MQLSKNKILLTTLVMIALLLAVWRPWRDWRPRGSGLTSQLSPVVILPFRTRGVGEDRRWLDTGLVDMFATELNSRSHLRAVRLERLLERAGPMSPRRELILSVEDALRQFRAEAALTGSISAQGVGFRLDVQLVGKNDQELLLKDHVVAHDFQKIFDAVDFLSFKVAQALGWTTPEHLPSIAQVTTSSIPAYRHYAMAVEDYIISDDSSLPQAADHLQLATAIDSAFTRAHFLLAKIYDQSQALGIPQGSAREPLIMANRFLERLPEWERQYARGWWLWFVEGDLEEAVAELSKLSEKYRDYAWQEGVPLTLGRLLAHQGLWPQAIQHLRDYVQGEETPTLRRTLGWGQLATSYQMTGNLEKAIEAMVQELSLSSGQQENRYWWIQENMSLALLHFENWQQELSEELLTQAQDLASHDARGLAMIGLTRFQMQQEKRAEVLAERALRQEGDLPLAHYLWGLIRLRQRQQRRAVANLEAACSQELNWDFLYHAAIAHARRGDHQSSKELLELLMDILVGAHHEAVGPADQGLLGILLCRLGRYDGALTHGLEAVSGFPYPQAKYDLACIYAIKGDKANAMKWLRRAFADGYVNRRQSRADFDLENLWYDPDFILLTSTK